MVGYDSRCHQPGCLFQFRPILIAVVTVTSTITSARGQEDRQQCYNTQALPQRCLPPFLNVAYNREVTATNTCGVSGRQRFCIQNPHQTAYLECEICDNQYERYSHSSRYITDFAGIENSTWWQSETLQENVDDRPVNLTIDFQRPYLVYHLILQFHASSPYAFVIYKKYDRESEWEPFQYFSHDCMKDFKMEDISRRIYRSTLDNKAVCTSEGLFDPLQGGTVAFRPLDLRSDTYEIANDSTVLARERWLTAEQIRISLLRINTFGDDLFKATAVLQSYFYAISDLSIGARCQCHGHAKECRDDRTVPGKKLCVCEHNTMGEQCNMCKPLYNNRPWAVATTQNANECQRCLCNGRSNKCEFDSELYKQTGNGGRCVDCRDNTAGVNCEKCKDNHHLNDQGICVPCNCDEKGSRHLQCDRHGQCPCKSGVGGLKCDRCLENHYAFSEDGCLPCECHPAGSKDSPPSCDVHTGKCSCKLNVEGQRCDICKPGFFNLEEENDRGCVACFCHGHSAICTSDTSYFKTTIQSEFKRGPEKWTAEDEYSDPVTVRYEHTDKVISVDAKDQRTVYFVAPEMFLGDRRFSYNRYLRFTLRISDDLARYSSADVVIDGADNRQIRAPIIANHQSVPNMISRDYTFQLHESFGWQPPMSAVEFMKLLKDVRSIKIRGTYFRNGIGFLEKVSLDSATDTTSELHDPEPATWVETCSCGDSYSGQFCEQCQPGYRRDPNNNAIGVYAKCIACECHGHSDYCDSETGRCICQHNTTGTYCERCEKRFYGNALLGKEDDCTPCPCPEQGECALLDDGSVTCLACPDGYKGKKCEQCAEGYFGDPQGLYGKKTDCTLCACNDNVDRNSINYCDARTGECLKCIYNTYGPNCETCKPGYYGNATSEKKGDCKRCDCHIDGTDDSTAKGGLLECHMEHGNCDCRHYVVGRQCDRCREGYWNLQSRSGCEPCGCDTIGSKSTNCDVLTGKCPCRPGVTGDKCEVCQVNHYGFSAEGCKPCDCDPEGSSSPQCDAEGQCICRKNFVGRTCNMCKDNTYKEQGMCKDCDYCYTLVQDAVDKHRVKLEKIHRLLEDVEREPNPEKSPDFDQKLEELRHNAEELWKDARTAAHSDSDLVTKLRDLLARIQRIRQRLNEQDTKVDDAMAQYHVLVAYAKDQNVSALKNEQMLNKVNNYLDNDAREALEEATKRSQRASDQSTKVQQISVEIRGLVEKVKEDVDSAMHNAIQAKNQSQIALTLAKQTLDNHQRATDAIQGLKKDQTDLRNMMVRAVQMAKKTQEEAAKAHDIALNELTEANNTILPEEGDIEGISSRARHLHLQASQLAKSADEMYLANKDFFDNAYKAVSEARLIVEEAQRQQQITDHLLDRVSDADSRAKSAVKSGNEILNSARNTLDTLKNFNSIVAKHRDEAQEHIKRIPRIEENIGTVAQKSNAVKELINDAEFKARQSKETAENALRIAKQAKTDISDVANDVRAAQTRANELDHESDRIDSEMRNMAAQLDDLERQTAEENHKVEEVTMGVSNAKGIATETIHQATTALEEVKSILSQLNSIDSYDENRLRELERKLTKLEEDYARGQIAERTKKLLQEKERQNKLMKGYVDDMEALKADVANIRDIRETLPDGCFNPLMIEVP